MVYIKEMRIKSWIKNIMVMGPIVFSQELFSIEKLICVGFVFISFCFTSSAIYYINDIFDIELDRKHPEKCKRPIASGLISETNAKIVAGLLAIVGIGISLLINTQTLVILLIYLAINLLYTLWLKHKPVFDCFCIAAGFVLRIYAGGTASGTSVSEWMFLTIVSMSLFMAFGKRRGELIRVGDATRRALKQYNLNFINGTIFSLSGMTIIFYALWALERGNFVIYTVPLVIFTVLRYLLVIHGDDSNGDPTTVIIKDKVVLLSGILYGVIILIMLYFV